MGRPSWVMVYLLWVPTPDLADAVETSVAELWPDAPLEIEVGDAAGDGLAWDGEVLRYDAGATHDAAHTGPSADAAIVLARAWLHTPESELGWVPAAAPAVGAPEVADVEPSPAERTGAIRGGYAGVGLADTVRVAGIPDLIRLQGGVRLHGLDLGLVVASPAPVHPSRLPDWVDVAFADGAERVVYRVPGMAASLQVVGEAWQLRGETWTLGPVWSVGYGVRAVQLRGVRSMVEPVTPQDGFVDTGPELGAGVQLLGRAVGIRGGGVVRVGVVDTVQVDVAATVDVLARM